MTRENLKVSKSVKVNLTADEVKLAILAKAGARNSTVNTVEINSDGSAVVTFDITKSVI